jgi:hypothetical protein
MNEPTILLQHLHDELTRVAAEVAGEMVLSDERLSLLQGNVRLTAAMFDDPNSHPAMAHCHVTAEIGKPGDSLDACVVGVHPERSSALADAARVWVDLVAGPILSLVHARPVLGAAHFDGNDPTGVPGAHGFVGPMGWRWVSPEEAPNFGGELSLFDYASQMAPPSTLHIAKATLTACGESGWRRNLEIDGHAATHEDDRFGPHVPAPPQGIGARFAVFHFADQPDWLEKRRRLDEALLRFTSAFDETKTIDGAADDLQREGFDRELVNQIVALAPLAAGRVVFGSLGVKFSPEFMRIKRDGSLEEGLWLMRDPVFARGKAIFASLGSEYAEAVKNIALTGAELNAINNALNSGSKLQDLTMAPPILLDPGVSDEAVEAALAKLQKWRPHGNEPAPTQKPWWRFW